MDPQTAQTTVDAMMMSPGLVLGVISVVVIPTVLWGFYVTSMVRRLSDQMPGIDKALVDLTAAIGENARCTRELREFVAFMHEEWGGQPKPPALHEPATGP